MNRDYKTTYTSQSIATKLQTTSPKTITKAVFAEVIDKEEKTDKKRKFVYTDSGVVDAEELRKKIKDLTKKMRKAAEDLEFEQAADLRDEIHKLEDDLLVLE